MLYNKFTIQRLFYLWGIVALMLGWLTEETKNTWVFIFTGITFVILVIGTVYQINHKFKRKRIKHTLADYLCEGQQLSEIISVSMKDQQPALENTMNEWVNKVTQYMKQKCGEDEVTLFLGTEGLISHWKETYNDMRDQMLPFLDIKLQRLHETVSRR